MEISTVEKHFDKKIDFFFKWRVGFTQGLRKFLKATQI